MSLQDRVKEVLEHYDYALIGVKGEATDNVIYCNFPTTIPILYRDLTISFGADRVSKHKGKVRVDEK